MKRFLYLVLLVAGGWIAVGYLISQMSLGLLSQEELSGLRVYAYRDWQSAGIQLDPGDRVHIRAGGTWLYTPAEYHGPEGHPRYPSPDTYPINHVPGGILLGRVGEKGEPFLVGKSVTFEAQQAGFLYLRINDDILSDNEGYVTVEIYVE